MISIHLRVFRGVSVSHTSHSITRNTLLLPNLAKNHQPRHSPLLIQVHQLRPSVMLKNTPTRDLLSRHWWPFSPPPSLISLGDVFCPLSWRERETQTEIEMKRKNGEMREKKKERKAKEMNKKVKGKKWTKKKVMKENVERKMWNKKKNWTETKNEGFWDDFRDIYVKREKRSTRNSRKSSEIKGFVTHISWKKKKKKKKRKMAERGKKQKMPSSIRWKKQHFFQIHQNRKVINVKLNEQENKKGELRQKRETISQDTEKQDKAWKIIEKHVQQERNQTKSCFLWKEENRKRKVKETIQDQEKRKSKIAKKCKKREYTARQKRQQVDRGWTKGGKRRQSRHS